MLAIYKKELKAYFSTMTGYAFIAFFSLVLGLVFYMVNVKSSNPFVGYTLNHAYVSIIFMVLVPVLTMKVFADERHSKTDQMLFTAPITIEKIVFGKFMAVATVFLIPVAIVLLYPLMMMDHGRIPVGASYSGILGFFLMGLAFFAIGIFISSVTENQVISAVATFALLLCSFMLRYFTSVFAETKIVSLAGIVVIIVIAGLVYFVSIKNNVESALLYGVGFIVVGVAIAVAVYFINGSLYEGLIQKIMLGLSVSYMYEHFFLTEVFDVSSIFYFGGVIVIFMFLTVQSIQKRRWS